MNIAIQMEIKVRELEGRSLLGLVAAERGHHVLVGDVRSYLRDRPQDFVPGVFHDKSLTPSATKRRFLRLLRERGWAVTSQDEEHWLNLPTFDVPAVRRFSSETLASANRAFAWGRHEQEALAATYPQAADKVVATGSPRVDLWRPELADFHTVEPLPGVPHGRPFVLFSANFSFVLEVNRFWVRVRDKRQHYIGLDDPFEFDRYDAVADKLRVLRDFVRAARHLATTRPDLLVVVRPHPLETEGAWEDLIGPVPNILISRERTLSAWMRRAVAVIQNGCTSGYEATVSGTPLLSFHPRGIFADSPVNTLGLRASSIEELDAALDRVLAGSQAWQERRDESWSETLARRLTIPEAGLSADLIVDEWERLIPTAASTTDVDRVLRGRRRVVMRRRLGMIRRRMRGATDSIGRESPAIADRRFRTDHKFPAIRPHEITRVSEGLAATLGRFTGVDAQVVAPDLVRFGPR